MTALRQWVAVSTFGSLIEPLPTWAAPFDAGKLWLHASVDATHFSSKSLRNVSPRLDLKNPLVSPGA